MTSDGQMTPPLYCLTHKGSEEGYGVLAPAERYTTIGVRSGKIRTLLFLLTAAEFKQPKSEEETLLFSFVNFGRSKRRKEARVLKFCLTKLLLKNTPVVPNSLSHTKPYILLLLTAAKLGL